MKRLKKISSLILIFLLPLAATAKPFVYYPEKVEVVKEEAKEEAKEKVETVKEEAKEKVEAVKKKVAETADKIKDQVNQAKEKVKAEAVKEEVSEKMTDKTDKIKAEVKKKLDTSPPSYLTLGAGLSLESDDFNTSEIPIQIKYEFNSDSYFRLSYTQINFDTAESKILTLEKTDHHQLNEKIQLVGGIGFGVFQLTTDNKTENEIEGGSAWAIGTVVSAGFRYKLKEKLFAGVEYQYSNASVSINENSYNAGYKGTFLNLTYQF